MTSIFRRLLLATTLTAGSAMADPTTIVVFDASGSMWGQLEDGKTKIEVAREVVSSFADGFTDGAAFGAVAYGHNRKGDCSDIELVVPPSTVGAPAFSAALPGIVPRGKTPLTDAIRFALKSVPAEAEAAELLVITDGLESCDADPCALVSELAGSGIMLRAHIVGFGLSEQEANALRCLPAATGGQLLRPQSAEDLAAALEATRTADAPVLEPVAEENPGTLAHIIFEFAEGTSRPSEITLTATPLDGDAPAQTVTLAGADEILTGATMTLPYGGWRIEAKGRAGAGHVNIRAQTPGVEIVLPYEGAPGAFELVTGAEFYLLGIENTFFVRATAELEENATYVVGLFPRNPATLDAPIDYEYRFGTDTGLLRHDLSSPESAGSFALIIFKDGESDPQQALMTWSVRFADDPSVWTGKRQGNPGEAIAVSMDGAWYYATRLVFVAKDGTEWPNGITENVGDSGPVLQLPESAGEYRLEARYYDNGGAYVVDDLGQIMVGQHAPAAGQEGNAAPPPATPEQPDEQPAAEQARLQIENPAEAGSTANVLWSGPGLDGDALALTRSDDQVTVGYWPLKSDAPVQIALPYIAGDYLLRYLSAGEVLAETAVEVHE